MNEKDILREIIRLKGFNQTMLAEKAGMKRQSNVAEMLRSRNLRVDNLVKLLDALECDLLIRSREPIGNDDSPEWKVEITE